MAGSVSAIVPEPVGHRPIAFRALLDNLLLFERPLAVEAFRDLHTVIYSVVSTVWTEGSAFHYLVFGVVSVFCHAAVSAVTNKSI